MSLQRGIPFDGDLRSLPPTPPRRRERPEREPPPVVPIPLPQSPSGAALPSGTGTPQSSLSPSAPAPSPIASFDGLDFANWGAGHPPDTNGDVGPTYYIQTVNTSIGIYRKSDGTRIAAFTFDTLMNQGQFGNLCDTDNFGDPVVLYDTFEDRWIITDFAFKLDGSGNVVNPPGSFQCFAVSKSGDPVSGGWNFYSINTAGGLGDYPKFGIWPNGLYMSANMFDYAASGNFQNVRLYAFNKEQMYAGAPTVQALSFDAPSSEFTMLPSNARLQTGTPPLASPNYFATVWNYLNAVSVYKFQVNWNSVSTSTLTGPLLVTTPTWWAQYTGTNGTAPSPANALDTLYPRLMVQNEYTNIGGVESIWPSQTAGAGNPTKNASSSQAAVRFYQLNVTGGTVAATSTQNFTYSPDTNLYRYMPSAAVNSVGDMAIGYTTSNATNNPAIQYSGRLSSDPPNTISQTEQLLMQGTGSQSGNCGTSTCVRWGDYSAMTLDPDGCTFWYTNEYYNTTGLDDLTRIGSFRFPTCTQSQLQTGTVQGTVTSGGNPLAGATIAFGSRTTTTDSSGDYQFSGIPAGTYPSLSASYPGLNSASVNSIVVTNGGTSVQNFTLTAAPTSACLTDTTQADFQAGVPSSCDLTSSPGNVILANTPNIDQKNLTVTSNGFGFTSTSWGGQTFTPSVTGKLTRIDLNLFCSSCTGTTPNITVSIRATNGSTPTGSDLATATIPGFFSGGGYFTVFFSSPPSLTAGTRYAVIFRPVSNPSLGTYAYVCSCAGGGSSNSNPYANGQIVTSADSGSTWSADTVSGGRDMGFVAYMQSGFSPAGTFVSSTKDANPAPGFTPSWGTISWTASTPANTTLKFQVAAASNSAGPFNFVGPDGTSATYFTNGGSLAQFNGNRYLRYEAFLTSSSSTTTPTLNDVTVCFTDVPPPDFSLSANPTSLTVVQGGASASSTITSTISGSLNSAVGLTASGVPSGVTVSFTPTSIPAPGSGTSTMTVTAGVNAAVGGATITVTGTAGAITHSIPVNLTVAPGGPQLLAGFPVQALGSSSTAAANTTGANLIVVGCGSYGSGCAIQDSAGNSWTAAAVCGSGIPHQQFFYALNPVTSSSHTFAAVGGLDTFVQVWAFSGAQGGLDKQVCAASVASDSFAVGSLTPAQANEILITQAVSNGYLASATIDSGFSTPLLQTNATLEVGAGSYRVYGSTAAINPTWTFNAGQPWAATLIAFGVP